MNAITLTLVLFGGAVGQVETGDAPATLLYVRTTPSGAEVRLDGERVGTSDDLFEVKPGAREIAIDLPGHKLHRKRIEIADGRVTRIEVQLQRQPPPEQEAVAPPPAATQQWVDVLRRVDLEKDRVKGTWARDQNGLLAMDGWHSRVKLPVQVDGSYDLEVDFTRIATGGSRSVNIIFPVGEAGCVVAFGGWGDQVHGLQNVDGLEAIDDESPAAVRPGKLVNGQRYSVRISVRTDGEDARIDITLDGKSLIRWTGKQASLTIPGHWKSSERKRPAVGMNGCRVEFPTARVRRVSSEASVGPTESRRRW